MRLLVAGGGTGGHLFPGIAVADEASRRGGEILFVGTSRGIETRAVPAAGYALETLEVSGLKRMGVVGTLRGLVRVPLAMVRSMAILRRFKPEVVLGVGGYASGPMVLAAALLGYRTAIQEQNSVPGITNRVLGRLVRAIFIAFEDAARFFPARKLERLGNPVRHKIVAALERAVAAEAAPGKVRILVVGGSQGARAVSDLVTAAAVALSTGASGFLPGPPDRGRGSPAHRGALPPVRARGSRGGEGVHRGHGGRLCRRRSRGRARRGVDVGRARHRG